MRRYMMAGFRESPANFTDAFSRAWWGVQVVSIKPVLNAPGTILSKLGYHQLLSNFALKSTCANFRHCSVVQAHAPRPGAALTLPR